MQLEKNSVASQTNLLQNVKPINSSCWYFNGASYDGSTTQKSPFGSGVIKITGSPSANRSASQNVRVNDEKGGTYILSGWGKATAVGSTDREYTGDKPYFGLLAAGVYTDQSSEEWHLVPFNKDYTDWQYASGIVVPKRDAPVKLIRVYLIYKNNANTAYFDNIHHGIMIYLPHIDTSNLERKGKMIPTNKAFDRKTEIIYDGKLYSRIYKVISEPGEYRLHFEFISTDSEYEQYIGLSMYCFKGKASIGGERVKLGRGRFTGMGFPEKTTPKQFDVCVIVESGIVSIYNDVTDWKTDITFKTPWVMPAMIVEKISDNSYIFHCNDRVYDDDFDDLVFSLEITKLE